jgi:hypothetical protein
MLTINKAILTAGVLLVAAALAGCGGGGADPVPRVSSSPAGAGAATPTAAVTSVSTSGELTDAEILWLARFNRNAGALMDAQGKADTEISSPAEMRKDAESQRACGRALAGMKDPGPRLQSVYRTFTGACAHFSRAAQCGLTAARYLHGVEAGSSEERKLSEALDCYQAELTQGSQKLADAYSAGVALLTGVPTA